MKSSINEVEANEYQRSFFWNYDDRSNTVPTSLKLISLNFIDKNKPQLRLKGLLFPFLCSDIKTMK